MSTTMLYCPLTPTVNAHAEQIDKTVRAWFAERAPGFPSPERHYGLLESRAAAYTANCCPESPLPNVTWTAKFMLGGFALDDWLEEVPTIHDCLVATTALQRRLEVPDTPRPSPIPADAWDVWCDIADGARVLATRSQFVRFCAAYRNYYHHLPLERSYRSSRVVPTFNDYPLLRLGTGGPLITGLEICCDTDIPDAESTRPIVTAFREAVYLLLLWMNDIATYRLEDVCNLLNVLIAEHGYRHEQAAVEAIALCNRTMLLVMRLYERMLNDRVSQPLRLLLTSTINLIPNLVSWHSHNPRYPDTGFEITDLITTTVPARLDDKPIPSTWISWWWQVAD